MMIEQYVYSGEKNQKYSAIKPIIEINSCRFFFLISCAQLSNEHIFVFREFCNTQSLFIIYWNELLKNVDVKKIYNIKIRQTTVTNVGTATHIFWLNCTETPVTSTCEQTSLNLPPFPSPSLVSTSTLLTVPATMPTFWASVVICSLWRACWIFCWSSLNCSWSWRAFFSFWSCRWRSDFSSSNYTRRDEGEMLACSHINSSYTMVCRCLLTQQFLILSLLIYLFNNVDLPVWCWLIC